MVNNKNNNSSQFSEDQIIVLTALHILTHLILRITLRNRNYYHLHFNVEETEAQGRNMSMITLCKWQLTNVCSLCYHEHLENRNYAYSS